MILVGWLSHLNLFNLHIILFIFLILTLWHWNLWYFHAKINLIHKWSNSFSIKYKIFRSYRIDMFTNVNQVSDISWCMCWNIFRLCKIITVILCLINQRYFVKIPKNKYSIFKVVYLFCSFNCCLEKVKWVF